MAAFGVPERRGFAGIDIGQLLLGIGNAGSDVLAQFVEPPLGLGRVGIGWPLRFRHDRIEIPGRSVRLNAARRSRLEQQDGGID